MTLEVEDNGRGLVGRARRGTIGPGGIGITSMRERAELMGGTLRLRRVRDGRHGSVVAVRVPVVPPPSEGRVAGSLASL